MEADYIFPCSKGNTEDENKMNERGCLIPILCLSHGGIVKIRKNLSAIKLK